MGLKPDHWIRKMALEHRMIEPFEPGQVRNGVISYGVSSYGYDVRVADEYKIFTNVYSTIVDPKNFDPKSMVDFRGEVCVIPPNSFVLARTMEYFRIPRGVLTVCLGKSTYARCFRGDTRVALVDGTAPTLEDMARQSDDGEMFWGYSIGENGRMIVTLLDSPRYIGQDSLVEVVLDSGESIFCTPDHLFMLRDGQWVEAGNLRPEWNLRCQMTNHKVAAVGDVSGTHDVYCLTAPEAGNFALEAGVFVHNCGLIVNVTPFEPCYSDDTEILTADGWQLFQDVDIGDLVLTMKKDGIAEWQHIARKQVYKYEGDMIHFDGKSIDLLVTPDHKVLVRRRTTKYQPQGSYYYKTDWYTVEAKEVNGRWNFEMSRKVIWEGKDVGNKVTIGGDDFPTSAFLEFLGYYIGDGSSYISKGGYLIQLAAFKPSSIKFCTEMLNRLGIKYSRKDTGFYFFSKPLFNLVNPLGHASEKYIPKWVKELPPHRLERLIWGLIRSDGNIETQMYTTASKRLADDVQEIAFKAGYSAIVRNVGKSKDRELRGHTIKSNYDIHKVRLAKKQLTPKIRPTTHKTLSYKGYIYDVTVPNHIIFVRRNGKAVWSGNCWEGYVTLEISNTTPLPAKIYSNEGIAQVLFFEADEECEISYADKKGKYQGQQTIVLPKI